MTETERTRFPPAREWRGGQMPSEIPSFPWKRESRTSDFSDDFWTLPPPNDLDSHLRGNDEVSGCCF